MTDAINQIISNRIEFNKLIVNDLLPYLIKTYPEMRFGQIISTFFMKSGKDLFYEEPQSLAMVCVDRILGNTDDQTAPEIMEMVEKCNKIISI